MLSAEAAVTAGASSQENAASAVQIRSFGDAISGVRFNVEGAWATKSGRETDAFGAAYPYSGEWHVIEAYGERLFRPRERLVAIRAGRFRTPFGIYNASDYAYSGFLRAPLIRYDNYYAISNTFLENGASVLAGVPALYVEASVGAPGDVGDAVRRNGVDGTLRLQATYKSMVLGASQLWTRPYQSPLFAHGRTTFTGLDARWVSNGVEVRGEWIAGAPFDGTRTRGGYAEVRVHRLALGPVTPVFRAERLGYDAAAPFALYAHRYTTGARVQLLPALQVQVDAVRQHGIMNQTRGAVDVAITYVRRVDLRRAADTRPID
jgi:hypothetical protein